jgi:hypothetical protein
MTDSSQPQHDDIEPEEEEEIEAYCVSCKQTVVMLEPSAVWTRRGAPGTRGVCEICGSTVFRMGKTEAHRALAKPQTLSAHLIGGGKAARAAGGQVAYINYSPPDIYFASQLAEDLGKMGVTVWFNPSAEPDEVSWATGVHPALETCSHMVVVLTADAVADEDVSQGWAYFREQRKPIVVALAGPSDLPDDLRRYPRYDFEADYKAAFRELIQKLAG